MFQLLAKVEVCLPKVTTWCSLNPKHMHPGSPSWSQIHSLSSIPWAPAPLDRINPGDRPRADLEPCFNF